MSSDPVIDEIHRIREAIAAKFGYDTIAIGKDAQRRDQLGDRVVVRLPPRPAVIPVLPVPRAS